MPAPAFKEVDILRSADGVVCVITSRVRDGRIELTASIQREFDRGHSVERTTWLLKRHLESARQLLEKLPDHLDALEDRLRAKAREERVAPDRGE
jgi:hypothetical protein